MKDRYFPKSIGKGNCTLGLLFFITLLDILDNSFTDYIAPTLNIHLSVMQH